MYWFGTYLHIAEFVAFGASTTALIGNAQGEGFYRKKVTKSITSKKRPIVTQPLALFYGAGDKGEIGGKSNYNSPPNYNARGRISDVRKLVFETHMALPQYERAVLQQNNLSIGL